MSIGSRVKELRIKQGLTQEALAKKIGVTKGAIANYENEISSPKIELMYKLFDVLDCDANYLHQDEMKALTYKNKATPEEFEKIIKKYRELDEYGKELVETILNKEHSRCIDFIVTYGGTQLVAEERKTSSNKSVRMQKYVKHLENNSLNAVHENNPTPEQKAATDQIMQNDSEWE